jgi:hypothetical protein
VLLSTPVSRDAPWVWDPMSVEVDVGKLCVQPRSIVHPSPGLVQPILESVLFEDATSLLMSNSSLVPSR